jgi:predicted nucleotidyltransferase
MISSKQILLSELGKNADTFRSLGVERLGIFGSFVRNTMNDQSDVDVLVEFLPGMKSFNNLYAVHSFLQDLTQRKVEIVTKESLSPYIGPRIIQEVEYVPFRN